MASHPKGPTLDIVADYLSELIKKRQGCSLGSSESSPRPTTNVSEASQGDDKAGTYVIKGDPVKEGKREEGQKKVKKKMR